MKYLLIASMLLIGCAVKAQEISYGGFSIQQGFGSDKGYLVMSVNGKDTIGSIKGDTSYAVIGAFKRITDLQIENDLLYGIVKAYEEKERAQRKWIGNVGDAKLSKKLSTARNEVDRLVNLYNNFKDKHK
jgi:hypothetical protein